LGHLENTAVAATGAEARLGKGESVSIEDETRIPLAGRAVVVAGDVIVPEAVHVVLLHPVSIHRSEVVACQGLCKVNLGTEAEIGGEMPEEGRGQLRGLIHEPIRELVVNMLVDRVENHGNAGAVTGVHK